MCCVLCAAQVSPLRAALRFVHPSCFPNLLRFAANQQHSRAAEVLVRHLIITPEQLLGTLQQPLITAAHELPLEQQAQQQQQQQQEQAQQQQQQQDSSSRQILQLHKLQQQQVKADLLNELLLLASTSSF
jgi:hypothetical protein